MNKGKNIKKEDIQDVPNEEPVEDTPVVSKFNVETPDSKNKKPLIAVGIGIVVAIVVFLLVWFLILGNDLSLSSKKSSSGDKVMMDGGEKVVNPITGKEVSEGEAQEWKDVRPLAVMVNNHVDARPQSGLIYADFVYEVVAEGGITRFITFYLNETPEKIGPVRSTREYYLVLVKEMGDAMLMHEGYSPQAKIAIDAWPVRSLFRGGASAVANWRDNPGDVAYEHTLYTDGKVLREYADETLGWSGKREFQLWEFMSDKSMYSDMPDANEVSIHFWFEGDYSAIFEYDAEAESYKRSMGYDSDGNPFPHKDRETKEQIEVENLIIQFVAESPIYGDDKSRLEYELVGSGSGLVFVNGKVIETTWIKESRESRTLFYDTDGDQIKFSPGKFWISIVPDRNVDQVVYN
ncbi:DUF3048 domain-containing protein [Patescibacteria group bacterium]